MKRIRTSAPRIWRDRRWPEDLPDDPHHPGPAGRTSRKQGTTAAIAVANRGDAT